MLALESSSVKAGAEAHPLYSGKLADYLTRAEKRRDPEIVTTNLTAQAYLIAHLPHSILKAGILWCLPGTRDLNKAARLLSFFSDKFKFNLEIFYFPEGLSAWVFTSGPKILLLPHEYLNLNLPSPQELKNNIIAVKTNDSYKPTNLLRDLEQAGYEPGPLLDTYGWFSKQGGNIIVADKNYTWIIEFLGDKVESIQPVNLLTGAHGESTKQLILYPRKLPVQTNISIDAYITDAHTFVGEIPVEYAPQTWHLSANPLLTSKVVGTVPLFGKQWEKIGEFVQTERTLGQETILLTSQTEHVKRQFNEVIPTVEISETLATDIEGFKDVLSKINYLSDRELTGLKRRNFFRGLSSFEQIHPGDYLVHIDHGIGRFAGLTTQTLDEVARDYFVVEYADEDKLFVPSEHTDRLSRYLGEVNPKLQRLHSASWYKITKRIKVETAILAQQLLSIYAKRAQEHLAPWQHFPEEALLASKFPWPLTPDQLKAWTGISADLDGTKPMDRLICGDVGFGKTELAVRAAFRAVLNGYQVALLAPTTILAQQHFDTFVKRLDNFGVNLGLLSRAQEASNIKHAIKQIAEGNLDVIIGTHKLLGRNVAFKKLGLIIVDEEQRFGVKQKEQLKMARSSVHVLALSATPIPRTLNLAVSSIRDLSLITTPPQGRQAVHMTIAEMADNILQEAITRELNRTGQLYFVVHHIKDLPQAELRLKKLFPKLKIAVAHGQLPPKKLAGIMHAFDQGETQLLLSTSIIENGLDLPNVNTIIIEGSEKFGLADLYQLKGRVGRSKTKGFAYFLINNKLTTEAKKRLEALTAARELGSGLSLALKDLELRGAGAILGRNQHGHVSAVGLHLYGQLLAQAIEEQESGQPAPTIPEVLLRLPIEGRLTPELIPNETSRIQVYQRLASCPDVEELHKLAREIIGRPLTEERSDRLFQNLITLLEFKLLAQNARVYEVSAQVSGPTGKFLLRFLDMPDTEKLQRLKIFDHSWHKTESSWQTGHTLAAGSWIPWLKECLKLISD